MKKQSVIALSVILSVIFFTTGFMGAEIIHRPTRKAQNEELERMRNYFFKKREEITHAKKISTTSLAHCISVPIGDG